MVTLCQVQCLYLYCTPRFSMNTHNTTATALVFVHDTILLVKLHCICNNVIFMSPCTCIIAFKGIEVPDPKI